VRARLLRLPVSGTQIGRGAEEEMVADEQALRRGVVEVGGGEEAEVKESQRRR
jgi:hypothetical protein